MNPQHDDTDAVFDSLLEAYKAKQEQEESLVLQAIHDRETKATEQRKCNSDANKRGFKEVLKAVKGNSQTEIVLRDAKHRAYKQRATQAIQRSRASKQQSDASTLEDKKLIATLKKSIVILTKERDDARKEVSNLKSERVVKVKVDPSMNTGKSIAAHIKRHQKVVDQKKKAEAAFSKTTEVSKPRLEPRRSNRKKVGE